MAGIGKPGPAPGQRFGGRVKGVPNKVTAELKDLILGALGELGGRQYLVEQGRANPASFLTLVGKVLPLVHPHLSTIDAKVDVAATLDVGITQEARCVIAQELLDRAFGLIGVSQPDRQIAAAEALPAPGAEGE
jgi:hypothetical protein